MLCYMLCLSQRQWRLAIVEELIINANDNRVVERGYYILCVLTVKIEDEINILVVILLDWSSERSQMQNVAKNLSHHSGSSRDILQIPVTAVPVTYLCGTNSSSLTSV